MAHMPPPDPRWASITQGGRGFTAVAGVNGPAWLGIGSGNVGRETTTDAVYRVRHSVGWREEVRRQVGDRKNRVAGLRTRRTIVP